jgi:hypothetical protein
MSQDYKLMKHHIGGAFGFVQQQGEGDYTMSALGGQTIISYDVRGTTDDIPTYTHGFWGPFIGWYSSVEENEPFAESNPLKVNNYPNPFRDQTNISFVLEEASYVSLRVYDINGNLVARLLGDQILSAGSYEENWDGKDLRDKDLASGSYLYELIAAPAAGGKSISVRNIMVMNR